MILASLERFYFSPIYQHDELTLTYAKLDQLFPMQLTHKIAYPNVLRSIIKCVQYQIHAF